MPVQPETVIVRKIRAALLQRWPGAWITKIHGGPMQQAGIPDLLCCIEGRFVALEVKVPGEYHPTSRLQLHHLGRIDAAGGVAYVVKSPGEAVERVAFALLGDDAPSAIASPSATG